MSGRWSCFVSVDGFSARCESDDQVMAAVGDLMSAVFRLGRFCFPNNPQQLFALQCGDGFLIASEFHEASLERCASIAVALMQYAAARGHWVRGAISEGDLVDVQDHYPPELRECMVEDHSVSLHMGLMSASPVMGTAITRPLMLEKIAPQGPLLVIPQLLTARLGTTVPFAAIADTDLASIDWVHMHSPLLNELLRKATLDSLDTGALETRLDDYGHTHAVPPDWIANTHRLLAIPVRHG